MAIDTSAHFAGERMALAAPPVAATQEMPSRSQGYAGNATARGHASPLARIDVTRTGVTHPLVTSMANTSTIELTPRSRRRMQTWASAVSFALLVACGGDPTEPAGTRCANVRDDCSCDASISPSTRARHDGGVQGSARADPSRGDAAQAPAEEPEDSGRPADASSISPDATVNQDEPSKAAGFVGEHGALRVQGNRVVDRAAKPIQLRGMSLFWSQWSELYLAKNVDVLVDEWKATVVRAALGVENEGGYLQAAPPNVAKVRAIVDRAIERGIYVIIDWHDHHAQDHRAQASAFFEEMAKAYGKQPHVLFEIYNEPMNVEWPVVKAYAEELISTIRAAGSQNLIIVGTPNWSQDVDVAASNRISSDQNVAYTLHFYADTHKQALRDKAKVALDKGLALFVTEWGTCSADGNGAVNQGETRTWIDFMEQHSIGWANWALNNKEEACSALQPSASTTGPWPDDRLTQSGRIVKPAIP